MLFGTNSNSEETISQLSHHVTARYFRFEPKVWNDRWACLRIEMYGCASDQSESQGKTNCKNN